MKTISIRLNKYQQHALATAFVLLFVIFVVFLVVYSLLYLQRNIETNQVRDALIDVASDIEDIKAGGNGYPATIPYEDIANSSVVAISGGSSFNGTQYCIDGVSKINDRIKYNINSMSGSEAPQEGSCEEIVNETVASTPGGVAVAYIGVSEIKVVWDKAPFASSYRLQCSQDDSFSDATIYETDVTFGICEDLQKSSNYFLRVSSTNALGYSAWSKPLMVDSVN